MNFDPETYGTEVAPGCSGCGPDLYDTEPAFAGIAGFV